MLEDDVDYTTISLGYVGLYETCMCLIGKSNTTKEGIKLSKEIMEVIESASKLQTNVDTLAEELKEEKSTTAEELNFTPKSSFCNVLGMLEKINEGKEIDDALQNRFTEITMLNNAYTYLSAKNDESKDEE